MLHHGSSNCAPSALVGSNPVPSARRYRATHGDHSRDEALKSAADRLAGERERLAGTPCQFDDAGLACTNSASWLVSPLLRPATSVHHPLRAPSTGDTPSVW